MANKLLSSEMEFFKLGQGLKKEDPQNLILIYSL